VLGVDRHPWATAEARWTYRQLRLDGHAKHADVTRFRLPRGRLGIVAAYVLNELSDDGRRALVDTLMDASFREARILILEPIARGVSPWWDAVRAPVEAAGGRADEWDISIDRPPLVATLDDAAGLDHRRVKARSLFIARSR
jgi:hypothetical protein